LYIAMIYRGFRLFRNFRSSFHHFKAAVAVTSVGYFPAKCLCEEHEEKEKHEYEELAFGMSFRTSQSFNYIGGMSYFLGAGVAISGYLTRRYVVGLYVDPNVRYELTRHIGRKGKVLQQDPSIYRDLSVTKAGKVLYLKFERKSTIEWLLKHFGEQLEKRLMPEDVLGHRALDEFKATLSEIKKEIPAHGEILFVLNNNTIYIGYSPKAAEEEYDFHWLGEGVQSRNLMLALLDCYLGVSETTISVEAKRSFGIGIGGVLRP